MPSAAKPPKLPAKVTRHCPPRGKPVKLRDRDAGATPGCKEKAAAQAALAVEQERLVALQQMLYAQSKHAVLVVLQAMDTGGKDGTIRRVFGPLNPQGVQVASFKAPTAEELAHDFLWRIHAVTPRTGMIRVFNRSHYEDVLIARVHKLAPREILERRYRQINDFERHLTENGVTIIKCYLHISRDEQRERLQARIDTPDKHWKFNRQDLAERKRWNDYQRAYELALTRCNTRWAPWHVIPADHKWYRDLAVAAVVRSALEKLNLKFPKADPTLAGLRVPK